MQSVIVLFNKLVGWFIPKSHQQDPNLYYRASLLVSFTLFAAFCSPLFAFFHHSLNAPLILTVTPVAGAMLGIISILLFKRTGSELLAAHLFILSVISTTILGHWFTGGGSSTLQLIYVIYPMLAVYLAGVSGGVLWSIICVLAIIIFKILALKGYAVAATEFNPKLAPPMAVACIFNVFAVMALSILYEKTRITLYQQVRSQQQKLLQSSKFTALGEMASGLAHEINSPLTIIQMNSTILKELLQEKEKDFDAILASTKTIEKTVARIASIVWGLRSFAHDASQDPMIVCDFKKIISNTLNLYQEKIRHHNINLNEDLAESVFIKCREVEISQALLSLIQNAIDAVINNQEKWIKIDLKENNKLLLFSISNAGPAIAPEIQDKIFQPFFTTKEVGAGSGLGLSSSKGIIESHGGSLTLDKHAQNPKFKIELPVLKNYS